MKLNLKPIGKAIGNVAECVAGALILIGVLRMGIDGQFETHDATINGGYDEAVRAIMNSDMFSYQKSEVVSMLKPNQTAELYKTIIHIVNSDMFSHEKVETIGRLCK